MIFQFFKKTIFPQQNTALIYCFAMPSLLCLTISFVFILNNVSKKTWNINIFRLTFKPFYTHPLIEMSVEIKLFTFKPFSASLGFTKVGFKDKLKT